MIEVILIVTSLWQGAPEDPRNTIRFRVESMTACDWEAAEWHKKVSQRGRDKVR